MHCSHIGHSDLAEIVLFLVLINCMAQFVYFLGVSLGDLVNVFGNILYQDKGDGLPYQGYSFFFVKGWKGIEKAILQGWMVYGGLVWQICDGKDGVGAGVGCEVLV